MINGKYGIVVHSELQQVPMLQGFGTPDEGKRHYLSQASHVFPQDEVIRETLAWFDKYLGVSGDRESQW